MSQEYKTCPACPRHCIIYYLARVDESPKDNPAKYGEELAAMCKVNYVKPDEDVAPA